MRNGTVIPILSWAVSFQQKNTWKNISGKKYPCKNKLILFLQVPKMLMVSQHTTRAKHINKQGFREKGEMTSTHLNVSLTHCEWPCETEVTAALTRNVIISYVENGPHFYLEHWKLHCRCVLNKANQPLLSLQWQHQLISNQKSWTVRCYPPNESPLVRHCQVHYGSRGLRACSPSSYWCWGWLPPSHFPPPLWTWGIISWTGSPDRRPCGPLNHIIS